ncbi:MAG: hypothetical protein OXI67_05935 [Candidatus Poribacteria bacterium]|nr:hypothetical protein [Candidatus Poribacteria bacterium]
MKNRIIYIFSFLLLCIGCTSEQQQLIYSGYNGNTECFTVRVRVPDNWKIVDAQLKTDQLILEFNRGKRIEKQSVPLSFPIEDLSENIRFRGTNRVGGLVIFHFTKEEDPKSAFNPPLAKSKISKGLRTREVYAIFRTSNWLMLHFSIENTDLGNLPLRPKINPLDNFKLINGVLYFYFHGKREKRNLPIHEFLEPHEEFGESGQGSSFWGNELRWTSTIEIVSKQK